MKRISRIIILVILLILFIVLFSRNSSIFPLRDYVEYWASGKLTLSQGNPYDPEQMLATERLAGWTEPSPVLMYNPPWTLTAAIVMSLLPYQISRALFYLVSVFLLILSADWAWILLKGRAQFRWVAWIVIFSFHGTLSALQTGQIPPLIMFGIALFLLFEEKKKFFWAGFFVPLLLIKPHSVYLFLLAIVFYIFMTRHWSVLLGVASGLAAFTIIPIMINPPILSNYVIFLSQQQLYGWMTATIGYPLRIWLGFEKYWLQFVPSVIGLIWFTWHWFRNRDNWAWSQQAPLVLLASAATASYGWTYDQPVVYLALIQVAVQAVKNWHWNLSQWVLIISYLGFTTVLTISNIPQHYRWWTASVLMIWYLLARSVFSTASPDKAHS